MSERPQVSVVVPVYGCAETIRPLYERVKAALEEAELSFELILVDDRSCDGQWRIMSEVARADERVHAIRLSRNYGQHRALGAGIAAARGEWLVPMDCDLQDPPEQIPRLLAATSEGAEIVYAKRRRQHQAPHRMLAGALYFRLLSWVTGTPIDGSEGTFSLVSRHVAHAYQQFRDQDSHYLFVLRALGFESTSIEYERDTREVGRSSYTLRKLLAHAVAGIVFSTTSVLHWVVGLGMLIGALGALLAAYYVVMAIVAAPPPGYTSLAVLQLVLGGTIIVSVGVVGIYVGKTFEQARQRPLWVVERSIRGGRERRPADEDDLDGDAPEPSDA